MSTKKYFSVVNYSGRDKLYWLPKKKEKEFEKLFGLFDGRWENHEKAIEWLESNSKFVGECTTLNY
jgi:hypothetical protein